MLGIKKNMADYEKEVDFAAFTYSTKAHDFEKVSDDERALAYFNRASGVYPSWYYPHVGMGRLYEAQGKYALALEEVSEALIAYESGSSPYGNDPQEYRKQEKEHLQIWQQNLKNRIQEQSNNTTDKNDKIGIPSGENGMPE